MAGPDPKRFTGADFRRPPGAPDPIEAEMERRKRVDQWIVRACLVVLWLCIIALLTSCSTTGTPYPCPQCIGPYDPGLSSHAAVLNRTEDQ